MVFNLKYIIIGIGEKYEIFQDQTARKRNF